MNMKKMLFVFFMIWMLCSCNNSVGEKKIDTTRTTHVYESEQEIPKGGNEIKKEYVCNKRTKKFHKNSCISVPRIKPENKEKVFDTYNNLIETGYKPCKNCNP